MTGTVVPPKVLASARQRRFLLRMAHDLQLCAARLRPAVHRVRRTEERLRRVAHFLACATQRHDSYQGLIERCLTACDSSDPEEMIRLRDAILLDHRALLSNPFLSIAQTQSSLPPSTPDSETPI